MKSATYARAYLDLAAVLPRDQLIRDPLRTLAYGTDASFYRLIPQIVVRVESEAEVQAVLRVARTHALPLTFRAAGTSLSGQAISDSLLVVLGGRGWRRWRVGPNAETITLEPGIIGAHANAILAPSARKIGPDPASINAAKIGGIAANNASGMCCGVAQNSYQTMAGIRVVLADGAVVDTADAESRAAFAASHGPFLDQLAALAGQTRADGELAERIRRKFRIKNTCGYSLNALVDFEDPFDILAHLLIGSEGTLGFISQITYRTVPEHPHKATALPIFPDVATACAAAIALKPQPVSAVELMDRASLRSVAGKPGTPPHLAGLPPGAAALLVETRAADAATLREQVDVVVASLAALPMLHPASFTDRPAEYTQLWNIRKGLFPAAGAMRPTGTTVLIEDVAFPIHHLAAATVELQGLFARHGYSDAIVFGHALEGNLHFVISPDFGRAEEVSRYRRFMDDVVDMVATRYDGSLKAEHGTGRNMAPFVELEWGAQAYALMKEIKQLFDPEGLLNPGVILNDDREAHIRNLKPMAEVDPSVDKCIECGFCEPNCPSRYLSLTPRQRIVGLREIARLERAGAEPARRRALESHYGYQAVDTCAADGLCALACPVEIDTGKMMKQLRGRQAGRLERAAAAWAARHYGLVERAARVGLRCAAAAHKIVGTRALRAVGGALHALSRRRIPLWNEWLPGPGSTPASPAPAAGADDGRPRVVYFPCCVSRIMGPAQRDPSQTPLPDVVAELLTKAGFAVVTPDGLLGLCCGQPFESKGFDEAGEEKQRELTRALRRASRDGRDPIVFDTSPCAIRFAPGHAPPDARELRVHDLTAFLHDDVLPRLTVNRRPGAVAIHATCSTTKMGLDRKLRAIAEACAEQVVTPGDTPCCGWAGDRGFYFPELNAAALLHLNDALPAGCARGYSTSRPCEIGLSLHAGRSYQSIAYLLAECAR